MGDFAYRLAVDHDAFEVRLEAVDRAADTLEDSGVLRDALREQKVVAGIDEEAIAEAFRRLPDLAEAGAVSVIARARRAVHGKQGKIEFKVDVSGKPTFKGGDAAPGDSPVDFKDSVKVVIVRPGELIAELTPPTLGEKGFTFTGKELPAKDGKPAQLRPGSGVEVSGNGLRFTATMQGRPVYSAGVISVSNVLEVPGDVDFASGNIKFNGHVVVHGNVCDDFTIEALSADIDGVVGASTISVRGPLAIKGGVNGRGKAEITADGNAHVKYVNQANLTIRGDLIVSREIVNTRAWVRGRIRAGAIMGGESLALGGFDVGVLGSDMGVNTQIEPGADFEVRKVEQAMQTIAERIDSLLRPILPFFGQRARYRALPEEKKQEYRGLYEQFSTLKADALALSAARARLLDSAETHPIKQVIVRKLIHPDVFVRTDLCMKQFKLPVTGPVALVEDIDASVIRPATYVPGKGILEEEDKG